MEHVGDPGLFGPGSATWEVHGDPTMLLAGITSLFLQALHPEALAGVITNSSFRSDPWGRLVRTADYVGTVGFGSTAEAHAAAARVREVHRRLGVDRGDLLRWVHTCEAWSFFTVTRACGLRLGPGRDAAYLTEQVRAGELIGVTDAPATPEAVRAWLREQRPRLRVDATTRSVGWFLTAPPMPARFRPAAPLWAGLVATAFGLLPGWARRMYVPLDTPATRVAAVAAGRTLRTALLAIPEARREGPHRKAARERLGLLAA